MVEESTLAMIKVVSMFFIFLFLYNQLLTSVSINISEPTDP